MADGAAADTLAWTPPPQSVQEPDSTLGPNAQAGFADADDIKLVEEGDGGPGEKRMKWDNQWQFILSAIGFAVGLGNVWRFPYLAYKNGGGAFLLPYIVMLVVEGVPLFLLELAIGQYMSQGAFGAWKRLDPRLAGIGICSFLMSFFVSVYYNVILAWCIYYLGVSFTSSLPWDPYDCTNTTSRAPCTSQGAQNYWYHEAQQSSLSINTYDGFNWPMFGCLFASTILVWLCVVKGIASSGKVVFFTATFPFVVLIILFLRGVTLSGAGKGIAFYVTPQWDRIAEPRVWMEAATQIFYSLGLGFGSLVAYASYNDKKNNCYKDAIVVCLVNCGTSIFAGLAVFAIIGHLAEVRGVPIDEAIAQGPGLAFIAYPDAVTLLPVAPFWSIMFFSMLICLGLDSQFGGIECLLTIIIDAKILPNVRKEYLSFGISALIFFCGIICVSSPGLYWVELLDFYSAALPLLFIAFFELVGVSWLYGADKFRGIVEEMCGRQLSSYWWFMWKWVSPFLLFLLFWASVADQIAAPVTYGVPQADGTSRLVPFPGWAVFLGWCIALLGTIPIPYFFWLRSPVDWKQRTRRWAGSWSWAAFKAELRPKARYAVSVVPPHEGERSHRDTSLDGIGTAFGADINGASEA